MHQKRCTRPAPAGACGQQDFVWQHPAAACCAREALCCTAPVLQQLSLSSCPGSVHHVQVAVSKARLLVHLHVESLVLQQLHQVLDTAPDVVHLRADLPDLRRTPKHSARKVGHTLSASVRLLQSDAVLIRVLLLPPGPGAHLGPVLRLNTRQHIPLGTLNIDLEQAHLSAQHRWRHHM